MRSRASSSDASAAAALGRVRVEGMTRGSFILRGSLAAAAVYGAGAVTPFVQGALAQSDASDAGILDFALRLEILEATFYDQALKQVPRMSSEVRQVTKIIRDHEHQHADTLHQAIQQLGVKNSPPPKLDFADSFTSEQRYLGVAQALEDTGVMAYNGAAPMVFARRILAVAGQIVQVEGRHAATIRDLRGEPIADAAFDVAKKPEQIAQMARPFIK